MISQHVELLLAFLALLSSLVCCREPSLSVGDLLLNKANQAEVGLRGANVCRRDLGQDIV